MSNSPIKFHKIWIDQCAATEGIRDHFGQKDALDYLIGEKFFTFVMASERDTDFAAEVPALSRKFGASLPLRRSETTSTIWNVPSSLPPSSLIWTSMMTKKSMTSHGMRIQ